MNLLSSTLSTIAFCATLFTYPAGINGEPVVQGLLKTVFPAQTYEHERKKYGRLHGRITINGQAFDFATGGRGRGSAPFGTYTVGKLSGFTVGGGKGKHRTSRFIPGYPLSDAYDPLVKDRREGLYIHPGHGVSAGCFAIRADEWPRFVKAMQAVIKAGKRVIVSLEPGDNLPKENLTLVSTGKRHRRLSSRHHHRHHHRKRC